MGDRGDRRSDFALESVPKGFRKRTLKTARLMAKAGMGMAKKNLGVGSRKAVDESAAQEAAERLVAELDNLKGLVMKFGQMASYLDHSLPPAAQRVLARLQSQSKAMAIEGVEEILKEDLGGELRELFDSFEEVPFAAASIGQVHRATLGGRQLAVKVQYPGIVDALESDLSTVGRLARIGLFLSALDGRALAAELRDRVIEECDYTLEARNQDIFHRLYADKDDCSAPAVVFERSGHRVLASEYCDDMRFQEFADTAPQEARDRAGATIFASTFGTIFKHHVFNADPHPGNYLFADDGHVTFLDFGCLKWFSDEFMATWKPLARSILDGDRKSFPELLDAAGLVGKKRGFDFDAQWDAMRHLYEPFWSREPTVYTAEFVDEMHRLLAFDNPNRFKMSMPADWLFANRLQFGLLSVLVRLRSRNRWGDFFREAVESEHVPLEPPSR